MSQPPIHVTKYPFREAGIGLQNWERQRPELATWSLPNGRGTDAFRYFPAGSDTESRLTAAKLDSPTQRKGTTEAKAISGQGRRCENEVRASCSEPFACEFVATRMGVNPTIP